jgi:hypothetical protein
MENAPVCLQTGDAIYNGSIVIINHGGRLVTIMPGWGDGKPMVYQGSSELIIGGPGSESGTTIYQAVNNKSV